MPTQATAREAAIRTLLDQHGIEPRCHRHAAVHTIAEAHRRVPALTINLLKTLAFRIRDADRFVLVGLGCDARVDYARLARLFDCPRKKLVPATNDEVQVLGFEPGGIGPFRLVPCVTVVLDDANAPAVRVRVGGGTPTLTLELEFGELARASAAEIATVRKVTC